MKQAKQAEPPSWFRPPVFTVGQIDGATGWFGIRREFAADCL
jgi:hypothetical protein